MVRSHGRARTRAWTLQYRTPNSYCIQYRIPTTTPSVPSRLSPILYTSENDWRNQSRPEFFQGVMIWSAYLNWIVGGIWGPNLWMVDRGWLLGISRDVVCSVGWCGTADFDADGDFPLFGITERLRCQLSMRFCLDVFFCRWFLVVLGQMSKDWSGMIVALMWYGAWCGVVFVAGCSGYTLARLLLLVSRVVSLIILIIFIGLCIDQCHVVLLRLNFRRCATVMQGLHLGMIKLLRITSRKSTNIKPGLRMTPVLWLTSNRKKIKASI